MLAISKILECDLGVNVVLGLVKDQTVEAKPYFFEKGLLNAAKKTCLHALFKRPIETSLQYFARILAFCELEKNGSQALESARISISHTPGAVVTAWVLPDRFDGIGVDIENKNRVIGSELEKYFLVLEDFQTGLDRLSIWCLKEAALKCMDSFQNALALRDISVSLLAHGNFLCQTDTSSCEARLLDSETDYLIAVAWQRKSPV